MKKVEPTVHLLLRPEIDWAEMEKYFDEHGGKQWFSNITDNFLDLDSHSDGQIFTEFAGRRCYDSFEVGLNPNISRIRTDQHAYFDNILSSRHGSVFEHCYYGFVFEGVSRIFTHELVRHRTGTAFSQESMRYVRVVEIPMWIPQIIAERPRLLEKGLKLIEMMEEFQRDCTEEFQLDDPKTPFHVKKEATSAARRWLPSGVATGIVFTADIRELRHTITMRTDPSAEVEMRVVFGKVAEIMRKECPLLFGDFELQDDGAWVPQYVKV